MKVQEKMERHGVAFQKIDLVRRAAAVLALARPRQQMKNALVLAGLVFSESLAKPVALLRTFEAVVSFCCASGAVYALNDLLDRDADRAHPIKRLRPVASRMVSPRVAAGTAVGLGAAALAVAGQVSEAFLGTVAAYLAVHVGYSLYLKHQPLIDLFVVALGYVLRAVGGAVAVEVTISPWLLFCTLVLALFLVVGKRHAELASLADGAVTHRNVLDHYSVDYLRQLLTVLTSLVVLAYSLYAISSETAQRHPLLSLTIPPVMYGLFRYYALVLHERKGGHPEDILIQDRHIQVTVTVWGALVLWALYHP